MNVFHPISTPERTHEHGHVRFTFCMRARARAHCRFVGHAVASRRRCADASRAPQCRRSPTPAGDCSRARFGPRSPREAPVVLSIAGADHFNVIDPTRAASVYHSLTRQPHRALTARAVGSSSALNA